MHNKQHDPLRGGSGPGLVGIRVVANETRLSLLPIDKARQAAATRLRRQLLVRRVHRLGERVLFELVDEIIRAYPQLADDIDERLEAYVERLRAYPSRR